MFDTFPEVPERFGEDVMLAGLIGFDVRVYERDTFIANVIDDNATPN